MIDVADYPGQAVITGDDRASRDEATGLVAGVEVELATKTDSAGDSTEVDVATSHENVQSIAHSVMVP
ncbi:MAG: hypothetical protein WBZ04_10930 [Candidatus Nanopelagicales bacterium]